MKNILLFILLATISVATTLLGVYVVFEIAKLGSLTFITQLTFTQGLVLWILMRMISHTLTEEKTTKRTTEETFTKGIVDSLTLAVFYLATWGILYLIF